MQVVRRYLTADLSVSEIQLIKGIRQKCRKFKKVAMNGRLADLSECNRGWQHLMVINVSLMCRMLSWGNGVARAAAPTHMY